MHCPPVIGGTNNLIKARTQIVTKLLGCLSDIGTKRGRRINVDPRLRGTTSPTGHSDRLNRAAVAFHTDDRMPDVLDPPPVPQQAGRHSVDKERTVTRHDLNRIYLPV